MNVGDKIRIHKIHDTEDIDRNVRGWSYTDRVGVVESIGEDGFLYGSWGKLGVNPALDEFDIVDYPDETIESFITAQTLKDKWRETGDGKARNELDQQWCKAIYDIVPCVGLPCTICYYTDKRAATVTSVISPKKIAVRHNKVECKDYYAGEYDIKKEVLDKDEDIFTKRKNGKWIMEGHDTKDGVVLMLHYQNHYIDPHF